MTRNKAIEWNKNLKMYMKLSDRIQPCKFSKNNYIALDMAIEALERELEELPSVTQKSETVTEFADRCRECGAKYGKLLKQQPCDDCISRQAVIDGINEYFHDEYYQRTSIQDCRDCLIKDVIKGMPSVTQQQKTGTWITSSHGFPPEPTTVCSECGFDRDFYVRSRGFDKTKYCPNCGAKMEVEG